MLGNLNLRQFLYVGIFLVFLLYSLGPIPQAQELILPKPGTLIHLSPAVNPPILRGLKVHPENPFQFEFILDRGDVRNSSVIASVAKQSLKEQSIKLIRYFLASLTIPEQDLWVNLSPYEKNRIVPEFFGQTEMGRDLLAEDYILKQITASLIYPENGTGKKFWKQVYAKAAKKFGTVNIPVNTFNKVWIVPEKAVVYENVKAGTAYVVEAKLKVMLEEDYLSLTKHNRSGGYQPPESNNRPDVSGRMVSAPTHTNQSGSQIIREVIIPQLTREVNEGSNFAKLRQVYNSLILAAWYKTKIKNSILAMVYENKNKIKGVESNSIHRQTGSINRTSTANDIELIYHRYLQAFKQGAYNYIKEEQDPMTRKIISRKYFSGGFSAKQLFGRGMDSAMRTIDTISSRPMNVGQAYEITVRLNQIQKPESLVNAAMTGNPVTIVREAIQVHRPDIIQRYRMMRSFNRKKTIDLLHDIYTITRADFKAWGLDPVLKYFDGNYIKALQEVFPWYNLKEGFFKGMGGEVLYELKDALGNGDRGPDEARILLILQKKILKGKKELWQVRKGMKISIVEQAFMDILVRYKIHPQVYGAIFEKFLTTPDSPRRREAFRMMLKHWPELDEVYHNDMLREQSSKLKQRFFDAAMGSTGGIDLSSLRVGGKERGIFFQMDFSKFEKLKRSEGFTPIIINIQILNNISQWLGIR